MNPDEYDRYLHQMHRRQVDEERGRKDKDREDFLNAGAVVVIAMVVLIAAILVAAYVWPVAVAGVVCLTVWAVKRLYRNYARTGKWLP